MKNISKLSLNGKKYACLTMDFEKDYGDRVGAFNILDDRKEIKEFSNLFKELQVPYTIFIQTSLLENFPLAYETLQLLGDDFHCHSHTHNTKIQKNTEEILKSSEVFYNFFGYMPLGYRAPQGVFKDGDIETIKSAGFQFSSSIFPSYRPGKFNNLSKPQKPFRYKNGLLEIPFSVVPLIRYVISLSYIKLIGLRLNKLFYKIFGLPNILIFDSHLHDFILNEDSFNKLPMPLKIAWGRNKNKGKEYFIKFVELLRNQGYEFITVTQLYNLLQEEDC